MNEVLRNLFYSVATKFDSSGADLSLAYQKYAIASFHLGFYEEAKAAFLKGQQVTDDFKAG